MPRNKNIITSAEQLHHAKLSMQPQNGSDKRLFIDLDICSVQECTNCVVSCDYLYHRQLSGNNGIASIRELVSYYLVCRRCRQPHCVNACPFEALEQQNNKDNLLIRHNLRCVSCKSCSHACPYGTIYPELVPFLPSNCDFCLDRRGVQPPCIASCPYGALALRPADANLDENTFLVGNNLIVHSQHWNREEA